MTPTALQILLVLRSRHLETGVILRPPLTWTTVTDTPKSRKLRINMRRIKFGGTTEGVREYSPSVDSGWVDTDGHVCHQYSGYALVRDTHV